MRAIRVHAPGDPDVLVVEDIPVPEPADGQVLLRIEAAGVNFIDVYHRGGFYPVTPPFTPGSEAAGVVERVGPGVTDFAPGDRVGYALGALGAYAEAMVLPAARLVRVPDGVASRDAAAVLLQGMTAQYLTTSVFALKAGDTCLVHAAAGGVGLLLCQVARRLGARVIGTASTEEKAALAHEAGAEDVILYTHQAFAPEVRRLTGGRGVDVVYDSVGRDTWEGSLASLRPRGLMVLYGQSSGAIGPVDPLVLMKHHSLFLTRCTLADYTRETVELRARAADVLGWVREGSLKVRIFRDYPLAEAAQAHRDLEGRRTTGKLILQPR